VSGTAAPMTIREALVRVIDRHDLTADQMAEVVGEIMDGQATPAQIGGLLVALRMKGETVDEIVGAARAMRARMIGVVGDPTVPMVDTCGTGGDGSRSVNVSTIAAFLVAGAGVVVAKHGNRAQSSQSGAHDVIEALGLHPAPAPDVLARCLREAKLAFLFAPAHHAATKHAAGPRKEVGFRTLFNLLGPLANPAGAQRQLLGVFDSRWVEPLARVLGALGSRRAWVVHGEGMDEIATTGATQVAELRDGAVRLFNVTPEAVGLPRAALADLVGGDPKANAQALADLLAGRTGPYRDIVLLNAAAALLVADKVETLRDGIAAAAAAIDDGRARGALDRLIEISNRA